MRSVLFHPLAIIALFSLMVIGGIASLPSLPVELLPSLKHPSLVIITSFANASAQEVESLLTRPVEEAVGTVTGLKSMSSTSAEGTSTVVVKFNWGTNMGLASAEIREKLDLIADEFPRDVKLPIVVQYDPSDAPVMTLALTGPQSLTALYVLAKDILRKELETVSGVASVRISGGLEPEIQVLVDPGRLAAYHADLKVVADQLEAANINFPGGTFVQGPWELHVRTVGRFKNLNEIGSVSIGRGIDGGSVQIKDVAEIKALHSDRKGICRVNGQPAVLLGIMKDPSDNTVQVAELVSERVHQLVSLLPAAAKLEVVDNESPIIERALRALKIDILWGGCLAFAVLLLFLRNLGSAGLVMLSIPVSVMSTFAFMAFAGVSLNIMSIGGIALGVGMLLDCSIVVLEAVHRKGRDAESVLDLTVEALEEVGPSVVSGTLTTLAVLIPILLMTGMAQRLFRDLAFTMGVSMAMSLLVSIFLLPAMIVKTHRFNHVASSASETASALERGYRAALARVLEHPFLIVTVSIAFVMAAAGALYSLGFQLLPNVDMGRFTINLTLKPEASIDTISQVVEKCEDRLRRLPYVLGTITEAGVDSNKSREDSTQYSGKSNEARIIVQLSDDLGISASRAVRSLRDLKDSLPDAQVDFVLRQGPLARILGSVKSPEVLRLCGDELEPLRDLADNMFANLNASSFLKDISIDGNTWTEHLRVVVDRYKAATNGISVDDVAHAVRNAVQGKVVGQFRSGGLEQDIRVRLKTKDRTRIEDLKALPLRSAHGGTVFLGQVAEISTGSGPREILRTDRRRNVVFHANVVGEAVATGEAKALEKARSANLPAGYEAVPGAERFELMASLKSLSIALGLAALLVYTIVVVQFESLTWPLVVFSALPFTIVGPAMTLDYLQSPVNVLVLIGAVVLIGIVSNMSILMVATINDLRSRGLSTRDAIREGCAIRLRPILMTTFTTVLGALPMCIDSAGADQLNQMLALTIVSGLLASTLFKLFALPVIYELTARTRFGSPAGHRGSK